jgi:hypothetical protein
MFSRLQHALKISDKAGYSKNQAQKAEKGAERELEND